MTQCVIKLAENGGRGEGGRGLYQLEWGGKRLFQPFSGGG